MLQSPTEVLQTNLEESELVCFSSNQPGRGKYFNLLHVSQALMTEAVSTVETSVNFYETTWRNIPEERHFQSQKFSKYNSHVHIES
jgi:hypothetical protein